MCRYYKYDNSPSLELLQPLPIADTIWFEIFMDFIKGLPKFKEFIVIFVVVDRLTKCAHFLQLSHPFTALFVAQTFFDHVYKLHGLPKSIISDRDKIFISNF